jgi:ribosomal protein S18 acetylase RimI-like enzyme
MTVEQEKLRNTQILPATPQDAKAIGDVTLAVWLATYPNDEAGITGEDIRAKFAFTTPQDEAKSVEERARRIMEDSSKRYWVAKDGDTVIGYCVAQKGSDKNVLQALNILPGYQGGGLGRRFMEQALSWLGDELPISLRVLSYNTSAIGFYERFGFVQTGRKVEVPNELPNGKVIPRVEIVRK